MPVVALFGGLFTSSHEIARRVAQTLDLPLLDDEQLVESTAERCGAPVAKLRRAMAADRPFFDNITHENKRLLTELRLTVAHDLRFDALVCQGSRVHLIPPPVTHVLRVCCVADQDYRLARAAQAQQLSRSQAEKQIRRNDAQLNDWTRSLFKRGPWDASLYDMKIPVHSTSVEGAVELVLANTTKDALKPSRQSLQAVNDFALAMRTTLALIDAGHRDCDAEAESGSVTININRNVLRLDKLSRELKRVAGRVDGVQGVTTKVGPGFNRPNIVREAELPSPSKYLLVDDEREFALTLSERLELRDLHSELAYGGEEALAAVERQEPAVMVLDLRMPGMGGMEVLRRIKRDHPRVQVIILTGHGTAEDERTAMELGAFAYLQKPVDINVLIRTINEAEAAAGAAGESLEQGR